MTGPRSRHYQLWFLAFANCAAVIVVCMRWVDRPVADRVSAIMRPTPHYHWTSRVLGSLEFVLVVVALLLLWWGVQVRRGRPMPAWAAVPLRCSQRAAGALAVCVLLKFLIGRSQVYPPWIERHEYGFFPLHGLPGYGAFPSATMAVAAAVLTVIWIAMPRWRAPGALLLSLVAVAIIMTNSHWVSDVIGGGFLGAFSGWMTVARKDD
jgi:membrane-associated phospholipid phosphatase